MEPIEGSETSAFKPQTPGKYPKENILHKEHGESLKSRHILNVFRAPLCPSSGAHDDSVGYHIGRLVLELLLVGS